MTARELRQKYLQFFESKGHSQYPSGSLIPYDVTGRLDESLLFNGAGMVQFKPFFRGVAHPPTKRLATAQKCVRTGDIESVGDLTHNTFFEMMGNFSFGDYFKKEAIAYSWEFITSPEWLGLDPKRVSYTVFQEDDEAYEAWESHLASVGIDPGTRIFRLGEETNYWPAGAFSEGPPGPCGPNSEMFYWVSNEVPPPSGAYTAEDFVREEAEGKWLEFWNDVFIQYEWQGHLRNLERPSEGYIKEGMDPLPFQSVDTGMGLERTTVVINGLRSNYDTDLFTPIIRKIEQISNGKVTYTGTLEASDTAVRIIADHIRTACFCIADGILPSNTGRGYVLRRLIRRAVLKGQRTLGFEKPFFHEVYEGVVEALGDHYKELTERREVIVETLRNEEALFRKTLAAGMFRVAEILSKMIWEIQHSKTHLSSDSWRTYVASAAGAPQFQDIGPDLLSKIVFPGEEAFRLYDTYGFPIEVTLELMQEAGGVTLDLEAYERCLSEAQERSRTSQDREAVYGGAGIAILWQEAGTTPQFVGYDKTEETSKVVLTAEPEGAHPMDRDLGPFFVALERTPFYTESGGQISDTGLLVIDGQAVPVERMAKVHGSPAHVIYPLRGLLGAESREQFVTALQGKEVTATIDLPRRRDIIRNHSATHLLHAALRSVLGKHVTQAGSLVAPDHLRFDFTHGKAMTPEELAEVERIVNEKALESLPVHIHQDIAIAEAKKMGAMALFGEKYGDKVRMVQMDGFSLELCGGCHVKQTSEIGLFKIVSEGSAASGVRRIEAVTGRAAYEWVRQQTEHIKEAASLLKSTPADLVSAVERTVASMREEKRKAERMRSQAATSSSADVETVGSTELVREKLMEGELKEATLVVDRLVEGQPSRVAVVALVNEGKTTFIGKAGPKAVEGGAHAGKLVGEIAKIAGGGGGGRPDFATAGAKNSEKVDEALHAAAEILRGQIGI